MIDRFGRIILIGYSEIELIWLEAANTLSPYERSQAFYDISQMTGRRISAIRVKANEMRQEALDERWKASARAVMTAKPFRGRIPSDAPSTLKQPSKAALMAGK